MSATQHTPGPWITSPESDCRVTIWAQSVLLADVIGVDRATAKANARLIAAAPDLLADLEGLVESVSHLLPHNHPALVNARASIARATGSEGEGGK